MGGAHILFILTAGFGWSLIAYERQAQLNSWPVSELLASSFSWLQGVAYLAIAISCLLALAAGTWWSVAIVLAAAYVFSRIFTNISGPDTQNIAMFGMLALIPVALVLGLNA